ncbi:MAG: hypothetical protein IKS22_05980 [Bacteroidales bacterium]|nr:hypothetical protein [Bacteroidales bacterium]
MNGKFPLPAGKNHRSGETTGTTPESGYRSPPWYGGQGMNPPLTDRCGKSTECEWSRSV